jgi:hypothetical protein
MSLDNTAKKGSSTGGREPVMLKSVIEGKLLELCLEKAQVVCSSITNELFCLRGAKRTEAVSTGTCINLH